MSCLMTVRFRASLIKKLFAVLIVFSLSLLVTVTAFMQNQVGVDVPKVDLAGSASKTLPKKVNLAGTKKQQSVSDAITSAFTPLNTNNYAFTTATDASLTDMTSGTTQLIGPDQDDTASAITNIGFEFFFQGLRTTQFSVSSNGTLRFGSTVVSTTLYDPLAQSGQQLIAAYGADQRTHAGNGKVHSKVTGTAPNRVLVVEWLNMQSNFNAGGIADLTYQVRLYETTGVIEFVYGSMTLSFSAFSNPDSQSPQIGFSSGNTSGNVGSVTAPQSGTPAPTFDGASATPVDNSYNTGSISVLSSSVNGSRRIFSFTPPVPTAPTNLNFTAVGTTKMTLNWTDSPDELSYAIYRSTDGVNYTFENTVTQNTTSYLVLGLVQSTNYFWKVFAVSEGAFSAALSGSQSTTGPGNISSTAAGGNWSNPATWVGNVVPTGNDNVTIVDGSTVTIDTAAGALNVTVGTGGAPATLQFPNTINHGLNAGQSVTISSNGIFVSAPAGTQTAHQLIVNTDLINNGILDFSTNGNLAGAIITFGGTGNNSFTGSGQTNVRQIIIDKGTSPTPVLELKPDNFTVRGVTTDTGGWLGLVNGTCKLSGTFTGTSRLFNPATYVIPATAGLWLNNPNYTVAGQPGTATSDGLLRITQGTYNIGTASGNSMVLSPLGHTIIEGGSVNVAGRLGVSAEGNDIFYMQSGGTVTVGTVGNSSGVLGSFDMGTSLNSNVTISGGTIVVQVAATTIDYRYQSGAGINSISGGTLQFGNAASGSAQSFKVRGVAPNVVVSNDVPGHTATWSATLVNYNNLVLDITVNSGATLNIGSQIFLFYGTTFTNNGTLNAIGGQFTWFNSSAPVLYTGSGTVAVPMTQTVFQADQGVTFDPTSPNIVVRNITLARGSITNTNKLTLGPGDSSPNTVRIDSGGNPVGSFDQPFTFNLGSGGEILIYGPTAAARTTGPEINPTRILTQLTFDGQGRDLTIAGGDLAVTGNLVLSTGRVITGTNTLASTGTVFKFNGYVIGNFRKTFTGVGAKAFEVGTANGYSSVTVNVTAGTFPADFTAASVEGTHPQMDPTKSLKRYWTLSGAAGLTADLTFNYLDADIVGPESTYQIFKIESGNPPEQIPSTVDTGGNTLTATGIASFSDWTASSTPLPPATLTSLSPTSAQQNSSGGSVTINGSIFDPAATLTYDGLPHAIDSISSTQVTFTLTTGDTATTGPKTVTVTNPGVSASNALQFTIDPANVCASQTTEVAPGASGRAIVLPGVCAMNGVDATLIHDGGAGSNAILYVASYTGNPTASPILDVGGGFVDLKVTAAVSADSVTATFYYPNTITGSDETGLNLLFFNGGGWKLVTGSGGAAPVKDTNDDQNGTTSGGTFTVAFDSTSVPTITQLTGTVFTFSTISPTAVAFDSATVTRVGNLAAIEWKTGTEVNNLGFNVYRQDNRDRVQVNPSLIAGSALMVGNDVRLESGYTYTWIDENPSPGATYWIEDVDLNGTSTWHGPFGVSSSTGRMITRTRSTLLNNLSTARQANSVIQREYAAQSGTATAVSSQPIMKGRTPAKASSIPASMQKQWQIAGQNAIKIAINKTGWYKVNASDLFAAGLVNNSGPAGLQMYVGGNEVPIKVNSGDGAHFDSIEFYGVAVDTAATDAQIYWLTSNLGMGKRINVQSSPGGNNNGPSSFQYTVERKERSLYFSSLRNGDAENWFGPVINTNPVSHSINIHNHYANSVGQAEIEVALQGVTTSAHQVTVSLNGQALNTTTFDGMDHHVLNLSVPESSLIEGNNQITFAAQTGGDVSLIDYVRVTYAHTYTADNNVLSASAAGLQPVKITGFTSDQIRAIDITNTNQPVELEGTIDGDPGNYSISVHGAKRRNLIMFTPDKVLQPVSITANQPTTISNASNGADFVIITNKDFAASIQPLVALRQSQGYQVKVVDVDNIYDEFNYGVHSPAAVKDFLNWTYTHWQRQPQFVMLAGGGTLDPRNYTGVGFMDFVPAKLIDTRSMETASDDWFVDFDNDGKPQMSIGRLPVNTNDEAVSVVNKIIAYEQSGSTEGVVLVSDLNDGIDFNSANNQIRTTIPANMPVTNITRTQSAVDARATLMDQLNQGGRIINYAGHGTVNLWRGGLLTNSDMTSLANHGTSPLVVTMTCLNGYFQDPKLASLGESLLKVNKGGAVSVWASSGMTDSENQTIMNQEFFRQLFSNPGVTIGQAIKAAKSATNDNDVRRTWILFGDPTMRIK